MIATLILIVLVILLLLPIYYISAMTRNSLYEEVADKYGLGIDNHGRFSSISVSGQYNEYHLDIHEVLDSDLDSNLVFVRIILKFKNENPGFDFNSKDVYEFIRMRNHSEVDYFKAGRIGFEDSPYNINLIAVFNGLLRSRIRNLYATSADCVITHNSISVDFFRNDIQSADRLMGLIEQVIRIADGIKRPGDNRTGLLENMQNEGNENIKALIFHILMTHYRNDERVDRLWKNMLESSDIHEKNLAVHYNSAQFPNSDTV